MKPLDYAMRLIAIDHQDSNYVVSLGNNTVRIPILVTPSADDANEFADVAAQIIAGEVARAMRDEDSRCGAAIDTAYLMPGPNRMWYPQQAAQMCRDLGDRADLNLNAGELHTSELHSVNGETSRQEST